MRKTKIICTLGPAVDSEDMIRTLIRSGMDAARFNFSHGSHPEHLERLSLLKAVRDAMGRPVATILDTKGPEIRIRNFDTKSISLEAGDTFTLTTREEVGDQTHVSVSYPKLHQEVAPGQEILIDDGLVAIRVDEIRGEDIVCTVENGGTLSANKSINIPGVHIHLPALTEKDVADIRFGVENDFDFIAASFVRQASDVEAVRQVLQDCGGESVKIIAKIENQEGVDNIDEILAAADGIMVARGDLGVEIPAAKVPILQKKIIRKGLQAGKPVITATQMLDSMMRNPRPTRAEVSDVANAVFDGTSCVMLSGETAGGKYPVEALTAMTGIVEEAEASIDYWRHFQKQRVVPASNINDAITHTCCLTAKDLDAKAILAATNSGRTARMICRFRPSCPVAALTMHEKVRRQLNICWGVIPFLTGEVNSTDRIFSLSAEVALKERLVQAGDTVVITAGVPLGKSGSTNLIKAQVISGEDL
ncbi:Pyruvate kinase [uncultured Flavonifractor sp.]|uniref:Pyruvate kinase n=1 Tax=Flintibacter hominis TaxID=2763048 RepID=A0A8J6J7F1_9FIRM|nr:MULTISPECIES: pyruvate kinase [Eubacteriales]MBS5589825.1 pyruvate kinase [Clostridiales bacterium]SCH34461.1 Pyruvate kinase [uncultured Clostridium sp.]SCI80381.1 Pyruvate kinase [uncultured Flavonifractor sp.]MBC5721318.1 pyruvate kinase [Flintibacter hominis]MCH1980425.1 pyruvate kinase [Lawsonibacter sp. OA9]